jgi:glycosyltransferase involved in cell wall biosynthesis
MAGFRQSPLKKSMDKMKLIRITTVPVSLDKLLEGQLSFMNAHYKVTAVSSEKDYLEKIGKKEGVEVFHLEMTRKITPLKDIMSVIKLYFFLKKHQPFIVHTHTPKAGITGMLAAKLSGVPHRLHTVAGLPLLEASGLKRTVLDFVEKLTYSCATKVYPNSYGLQSIILKNKFCTAEKLKVLANGSSNGIDTQHFSRENFSEAQVVDLKRSLGIAEDDFVFIFVGRLVGDKGINELARAFEIFSSQSEKTKLLLVGTPENDLDPLSPATLHIIEKNKSILSVGFQRDVRPYLAISDALVFPSYREGFPNVVMQAGAMGLPCIVSDINGCNEIISQDENGLIIPVKNDEALLTAMQKMVSDASLFEIMKEIARPMIVKRYEQNAVWQAILDEYRTFGNSKLH